MCGHMQQRSELHVSASISSVGDGLQYDTPKDAAAHGGNCTRVGACCERVWHWLHRRRRDAHPQTDRHCDPIALYDLANCLQPKFHQVPREWSGGGKRAFTDERLGCREQLQRWRSSSEPDRAVGWECLACRFQPGNDGLSGVAAIAPNDVWAAGSLSSHQPHPTTLIEHWNGSQWSIVTSPNPGPLSDTLSAVAAVAANDVWAVGESVTGNNATQPLIERWDGAAWHVVSSSVPAGATASSLNAVTRVPETNQLWAVGSVRIGTPPSGMLGYFQPLVERWDGSSWQVITSPSLPSGSLAGSLNGVVALSTTDAWAVGDYTTSDHKLRALITHWDGSAWKMVTSPDAVGSLSVVSLGTVAAANAQDVRVVGHTNTGNGQNVSLIAQWNGDTWQDATSPVPSGAIDSGLGGIASDGAGNFWAVGSYRDTATTEKTLTLHCP
jgi:hypothetical protein